MKKKRIIKESHIRKMVKECVQLLTEERYDKIKPRVFQVFKDYFTGEKFARKNRGYAFQENTLLHREFEHVDNPQHFTYIEYMIHQFEETFFHDEKFRDCAVARLAPMIARMALEDGNFQQLGYNCWVTARLSKILGLLYLMQKNGQIKLEKAFPDNVIDTMTFEELNAKYGPVLDEQLRKMREQIREKAASYTGQSDYELIEDVDFNTAREIGQHSGINGNGAICYATQPITWSNYTADGKYKVYVLLKKGWRDIPAEHDDETKSPYDTYGMSMIFVGVAPDKEYTGDGEIAFCNTRWNHAAKYTPEKPMDYALDELDLSNLVQKPFNDVFTPYTKEELRAKGLLDDENEEDDEYEDFD